MLIREKVAQAVGLLREFDVDSWITFTRESGMNGDPTLAYLLAADVTWHTAIILTKSGRTCAIVGEYDRKSVEDLQAYGEVHSFVKSFREPFLKVMRDLAPSTIAVNFSRESEVCDGITHGMYLTLSDLLGELGLEQRIIQADRLVSALRQRKTPAEITSMKKAIQVTEEIFRSVAHFLRPGRTEREIAAFMKDEAKRHGVTFAWDALVCPAVFTGPESAGAHYAPTDRPVEHGQLLNMDFGVKVDGYCSDLQRTFYVLAPGESRAPEEVQRGFDAIVRAIEESKRAIRPGVKGVEIDGVARGVVTGAGYPEFPHGLGHQVGRFAHDGTALLGPAWEKYASKPFFPLEAGMVFTLEPRLPVEGRGIATIEEMVVVTDGGAEWLSTPQKDLLLVQP